MACGSDALRFSLLAFMVNPRQINLDLSRVVGYRNFCNKIWNAFKYAKMQWPENWKATSDVSSLKLNHADKWILSKLHNIIQSSNEALKNYEFGTFANNLYDFWLKEFCDIYIEVSKISTSQDADEDARNAA